MDSNEAPSPTPAAAAPSAKMSSAPDTKADVDKQNIKSNNPRNNNNNPHSPSRPPNPRRNPSSNSAAFKGARAEAGSTKPPGPGGHANVNANQDSSKPQSLQRTVATADSDKPSDPSSTGKEKKSVSSEHGPAQEPQRSNAGPAPSSSSNHHPNSPHSGRGGRGGRGGSNSFNQGGHRPSESNDGHSGKPLDSTSRFAASSGEGGRGGRGRGGYTSGYSSRGRGGSNGSFSGRGDVRLSEGDDSSIRGRKFERRPPSSSHRTFHSDSTDPRMEPPTSTTTHVNAKPEATSGDASSSNNNNSNETPTKDSTGGLGTSSEQRPSSTAGVREFKRAQQMITRSPRSPRSPRRGFERGGDARNGPSENATLEGSSASTTTPQKTTATATIEGQDPPKIASTSADATLTTEHSGGKEKPDRSAPHSSVDTKEGSSTGVQSAANPETPPKKRKPARKSRKDDDEASSTVSVGSGKDNTDSATVAPTAASQRDRQARPDGSNSGTQTKEQSRADPTTTNVSKESADGAWVPKSKATRPQPRENNGISPGYLGKNPIPNYQRPHTQDSRRSAPETTHGTVAEDAASTATTETATFTPKSKKKAPKDETPILLQSGWGEPPETLLTSTVESGGWGESVNPRLRWGEEVPWESPVGLAPLSEPDWVKESTASTSQSHSQQTHREVSDSSKARRDKFGSGDQAFSRPLRERTEHGAGRDRERADRGAGRDRPGPGRGGAVTGDARFSHPSHPSGESHQQRRVGQYQEERANGARTFSEERPPTDSVPPKDARSSLDKRNERLALQRGPHPNDHRANRSDTQQQHRNDDGTPSETLNKEGADDDATANNTTSLGPGAPQTVPVETNDLATGSTPQRLSHKSADIRLDPRYNANSDRESTGSGSSRPSYSRNGSSFTNYQQRSQSSSSLVSQDAMQQRGSVPVRSKLGGASEPKLRTPQRPPLFSTSLKCQMSWEEMGLKPCVLEGIQKAGLERPSNIQKLMMKPFTEGKDVLAQSQSQRDRTNTLGMALLQKLSSSTEPDKRCKAIVICSDGTDPARVFKDLSLWFESSPDLQCLFLEDTSDDALADPEQAKQVIVTTLGPLMEVLKKDLMQMSAIETVMISMRSDELVGFDAFKRFWALLPRGAQVVLMTGLIQPKIQTIKEHNFRSDAAVVRADELTLQWSEHYYVDLQESTAEQKERQRRERAQHKRLGPGSSDWKRAQEPDEESKSQDAEEDEKDTYDRRWEILTNLLTKNPDISHIVIVTQSQSLTQALTDQLKEQNFPVLSIWSMADKTAVVKQFNKPERCILVLESALMENLDLDHYSLLVNYEMPKRALHYISSFGPFGRSGLRTMMINFCVTQDRVQRLLLEEIETMYDIRIQEMKLE